QSGKILRVKGEGFPNVHGQGKGDLLVRLIVETPSKLSSKQKELFESLTKLETPASQPQKHSFFEKISAFFSQ
ncbi:MAG: DnaJ C-terminal domain-containing protein, partial [Chlamydiota bacterium]